MIWFLLQIVPILVLLYLYVSKKYSYWSNRGVNGPRPIFPFGYTHSKAIHRPDEIEMKWLKEYGKVYGVYTGLLPTLTISDAELIKQVLVKDFHLFVNRRFVNSYHDIWNRNLFLMESDDWKRVRSITSPAFTSGKLRNMYPLMDQCIEKLTAYMDKIAQSASPLIDTKETISGFTIDVIASTSFATETSANDDRSRANAFVHHGMRIFKFHPLKIAAILILPRPLLNAMGVKHFFKEDSFQFFVELTRRIVQQRQDSQTKRNDLVQLMMDTYAYEDDLQGDNYEKLTASMDLDDSEEVKPPENGTTQDQNKSKKMLNENEIIAQCMLFFLAGFETTAATLTHAIYELAQNPDCQDRLYEELCQATLGADPENRAAYFDLLLNHVPYLDAVIKETLRKHSPVIRLERRVGADNVKLGGILLDKGTLIEIPTYAVHHNPEYYPEPEQFNPDRFLPENKHLLVPYTYLPFGQGPRNCIGMRFAYQEAKLCLAQIVQRYRFKPTVDTPSKLTFARGSPMLSSSPFKIHIALR